MKATAYRSFSSSFFFLTLISRMSRSFPSDDERCNLFDLQVVTYRLSLLSNAMSTVPLKSGGVWEYNSSFDINAMQCILFCLTYRQMSGISYPSCLSSVNTSNHFRHWMFSWDFQSRSENKVFLFDPKLSPS